MTRRHNAWPRPTQAAYNEPSAADMVDELEMYAAQLNVWVKRVKDGRVVMTERDKELVRKLSGDVGLLKVLMDALGPDEEEPAAEAVRDGGEVVEQASDLGWAPGTWPERFEYNGLTYSRGEFRKDPNGEVAGVLYTPPTSMWGKAPLLEVAND